MTANGVFATCAVTALVAQNTTGVRRFVECAPDFLAEEMDCVFTDIFPDAVKTGMVASVELIGVIAEKLRQYGAKNVVVDPVMVSTSGSRLLAEDAAEQLILRFLPLAVVITPNIPEAEVLSGRKIQTVEDMTAAAAEIGKNTGSAVLVKGGHHLNDANDLLYHAGKATWFYGERIENPNTHGTGCTLSSAIACGLAAGLSLEDSVRQAKAYISGALRANLNLGQGSGPMNHCFCFEGFHC